MHSKQQVLSKLSHTELHHLPHDKRSRSSPSHSRSSPCTVSFPSPFLSSIRSFLSPICSFLSPIPLISLADHPHFFDPPFHYFISHSDPHSSDPHTSFLTPTHIAPIHTLHFSRTTHTAIIPLFSFLFIIIIIYFFLGL